MNKDKQVIYKIAGIYISLFAVLIGYLVYFTAIKQKQISVHPSNTRLNNLEQEVVRGNIYDTNMNLLAETVNEKRNYTKGSRYAHVIGYSERGKTGIEALANTELLYPNYHLGSLFKNAFANEKFEGRDIVLTLDDRYQEAIQKAMEGKKGGVVVIEPTTGKIKAMFANPGFDPNNISGEWENLTQDTKNSPLVNRATNGLYPPGSIFKIITALAYMEGNHGEEEDFTYECTGKITGADYAIQCYNKTAHGHVDLESAFYKSCNAYFIELGKKLSVSEMKKAAETLGFNHNLHFDMGYAKSRFQLVDTDSEFEKAATAIGQGKTLTTPLHMAILAAAIANDGVMMKPYVLDYSMNRKGQVKVKYLPQYKEPVMKEEAAKQLQNLMLEVVTQGTGRKLKGNGLKVGGKTGTAQNETQEDHSWFIGFAEYKNQEASPIAFAVLVENGGKGAEALDVTQTILNVYQKIKP